MLNIAVCMKQVPALNEGKMDESTGTLVRKDIPPVINPYDLTALEAALRVREACGGSVTVFTMGPPGAESLLRESFAMGADAAYLITGREFAGADAVATAYTLSQAICARGPFDLILCGRQTTDGDTAQVSGAIAEFLRIPSVNWVSAFEDMTDAAITVSASETNGTAVLRLTYPCLLSVERELFTPRIPGLKAKMASRKMQPGQIGISDLPDQDPEHFGMRGSSTRVVKIFSPISPEHRPAQALNGEQAAEVILQYISQQGGEAL